MAAIPCTLSCWIFNLREVEARLVTAYASPPAKESRRYTDLLSLALARCEAFKCRGDLFEAGARRIGIVQNH